MAKFYLNGDIVDNGQSWGNDVSPQMLKEFIDGLQDNEDIELEITSFGGSCTAGNAMVSMLRGASANGHRTIAHVVSIAASMASVVACACDELVVDSNAFVMVHLPWTTVEGNYEQMRKEADTLELFTKSLISVYRTKFNLTDDEIISLLQAETWILGEDAEAYGLNCSINKVEGELKVAASCKYGYRNIPRGLVKMEDKTIEENEKVEEKALEDTQNVVVSQDETTDEKKEETPTEEKSDEEVKPTYEELLARIAELEKELDECQKKKEKAEDTISKDECEKRVSGMQASMQKQINEHLSQLKAKDEEIRTVKAELSVLNSKLEETNRELTEKSSALEEKTKALAMLNAGVNAQSEDLPTMKEGLAKCATPAERVAFLKAGKFVL